MSTERMDNSQGTARMDTGTARMDASTARIGGGLGTSPIGGGTIFAEGQAIVLNGNNCVIESLISKGSGEAVVYKISISDKPYALKHYKPNTPLSDTAKKVLTKIRDNPREKIITIFDIGNYNGQDFEIMEYAEGGTLSEFIRKNGVIRDNTLKDMVRQINEGLQQLHGYYKTIYQDLKPENIFFRDAQQSSLVLADFGISSVMQGGIEEVEVIASNTDLYAAPELARKGNNTTVEITPAVDYFALGITMYELWLGEQPFKEIKAISRERSIRDKEINFPVNMPDDYKALIQGLIDPLPKDRWKNEQVQKWLKGEPLTLDFKKPDTVTSIAYDPPLKFGNESATNHKELAALMEKYPKVGKDCLYDDIITKTLIKAGDAMLYSDIKDVISQYGKDRETGLTAAIYTLDPERPFISRKGKTCKSSEEIADAIMDDSAHYMDDLTKPNASLYVYITVTGGSQGKETAGTFRNFFKEYPPNRALTLVYLKLQSDSGIPLGSKRYLSIDELAQEKDDTQIDLIKKAVMEKDSPLLVWISDKYSDYFKSTDEFNKQSIPNQFFLLGLLPFLSFKELTGSSGEAALKDLIDNHAGRSDLFDAYVTQGLPLKGQILDSPQKKTPIDYVVCHYNDLSTLHGSDIVYNLIRLLHDLGADVNEYSSNGRSPFINALARNDGLVKLLLELGADGDFVSKGGKICKNAEGIADAIMAESSHYMDELKNPKAELFLCLLATGGTQGKEFVENFCKYFREYPPKRALALVYVQLQSDLGITIGTKRYQNPDELKLETNNAQISLVKKAVMEKDSLLFAWISVHDDYFRSFKSIEAFNNLTIPDQFYLLGLLPFLSYKELKFDWENTAITDLRFLIDYVPGEIKLFEAYAGQGLPLKGQLLDSPVKRTPIDYIVCNFKNLSENGADTVCSLINLIRFFCKHGADINEYSSDGTCPLINAFEAFFAGKNDLVNLLLEQGAEANQYREFFENREKQELLKKEQECRIAQEKKTEDEEYERRKAKNRDSQRIESEKKYKREKIQGNIASAFIAAVILSIIGFGVYMGWFAFLFKQHIDVPDTAEAINDGEFVGKQLTSATIPDSVTSIGKNAFRRNGLSSVAIPAGVDSIGDNAFANNRLKSITIGANVTLGSGAFNSSFEVAYNGNGMAAGTYTRRYIFSSGWSSWHGDYQFKYLNEGISIVDYKGDDDEIEIPAIISGYPVIIIGDVFKERNLTSVTIPDSIASIENEAFRNNKLTSVTIGNGVTWIGHNAFDENQLTNVTIPNSVASIGNEAFRNNKLKSVTIGNGVTSIGYNAFSDNQLANVTIPNSVTSIGNEAFRNNKLTSVTIGNAVFSIGYNAFDVNKLTNVAIPNSVTSIGKEAFCCNQLAGLTIGNSVNFIGDSAFNAGKSGRGRLTSVSIPNSVTSIGVNAFADQPLTSVRIGANVKLGDDALNGILGQNTGFNTAYSNNGNRAGTYTRANAESRSWTRR